MDLVRVHVFAVGEVQGVSFRKTAGKVARELGVTGWVRNLPDGRIEAIFEGSRRQVATMVEWCSAGPSRAYFSRIIQHNQHFTCEFSEFTIGHDEVVLKPCIRLP